MFKKKREKEKEKEKENNIGIPGDWVCASFVTVADVQRQYVCLLPHAFESSFSLREYIIINQN